MAPWAAVYSRMELCSRLLKNSRRARSIVTQSQFNEESRESREGMQLRGSARRVPACEVQPNHA